MPAAIDFQSRHDWPAVRSRCHALAQEALEVLTQRFGTDLVARDEDWAQMLAIPVARQNPDVLRRRLYEESRIEVPITSHGDQVFVRVSVQGYNTRKDIEHLLAAPALN